MKKVKLFLYLVLFSSCTKHETSISEIYYKSKELSSFVSNLGVESLSKNNNYFSDKISFTIKSHEQNINGYLVNLNQKEVIISSEGNCEIIEISGESEFIKFKIDNTNKKIIDLSSNSTINDDFLNKQRNIIKLVIGLSIYNEIQNSPSSINKFEVSHYKQKRINGCSMSIVGINYTKSASAAGATSAANNFISAHPDCKKVNGLDSVCIVGDYACVTIQEISCSGSGSNSGCNVSYGLL